MSPVVFSSCISRCIFYFREFFSIINGATLNMSQTKSYPALPALGQSVCRSHSIPKMETSLLHVNLSFEIIYMFYI